ncbi:MAG: carbamoyl-phosphate synthase large subunit [Armatimonadetes bacterium]|nr:carbamoyl-phosphate synthase large subunit [Armatimonadota bacterium]MDE2205561.1 carbamoyl-phosphate synthase large subunit [Armatimonadota bacterium]
MPRNANVTKVMVIGSGPIIIGQAAEFDYAGTQACRALREEGVSVVLVNSNPATIMTDPEVADRVYIEPLTVGFADRILAVEKPDGLLPTLGGQTGLNLATRLAEQGVLERHGVRLLGTPLRSIHQAEDRDEFRALMRRIGEPVPESWIITELDQLAEPADSGIWPLIVRPAYTLGGTGGGIAHNSDELRQIAMHGLALSMRHQVMVERFLGGWKEIEYEVMRDANDTAITVCNMENFDPMGVHTGDSIVVAPSQTLSDREYQMLRTASLKIIRALGIEGGCNVQLALDPTSMNYCVIEVNPRVSRSSALASKATGYPIARVAAKIAVGLQLDEIENAVTQRTLACFEPALDYCVVKIPRWPFDKFVQADKTIGTQMKATGEVMAIDRSFESALLKALRSLEVGNPGMANAAAAVLSEVGLEEMIRVPNSERLWAIFEGMRRGMSIGEVRELCNVDRWFLKKLQNMVEIELRLKRYGSTIALMAASPHSSAADHPLAAELIGKAKQTGFGDRAIAEYSGATEAGVSALVKALGIGRAYKVVDTCAAEFEAATPYFYSCYEHENEASQRAADSRGRIVVLGSGPIRIGQGIEFDYCSVHCVKALQRAGYGAVIINNNPETVSTDFDISDRLYFEPLAAEDVIHILEREQPEGVIVQFGGQTAINLAQAVSHAGYKLLGSSLDAIKLAEDRDLFDMVLRELAIAKPPGRAVTSAPDALAAAEEIGYPVVVRPSWVLGGRAMEIVYSLEELRAYIEYVVAVSPTAPILIDRYILGREVEVDVICDGAQCLIPGIMEHIERAGVHSGDSMAVYPPQSLGAEICDEVVAISTRLAVRLGVVGLMNIQFVVDPTTGRALVLEVNPRASRTVPFLSKVTGIPMVDIAVRALLGESLAQQGLAPGLHPAGSKVAVKAPVFSFAKLTAVDVSLGPEMKSTGEIMGIDRDYPHALYKAMVASGIDVPAAGRLVITVADQDKQEVVEIARGFVRLGFTIIATEGTLKHLAHHGIAAESVSKLHEDDDNIVTRIRSGSVDLLINTLTNDRVIEREGTRIRRASVEYGVPCLTSLDTARALLLALEHGSQRGSATVAAVTEYL